MFSTLFGHLGARFHPRHVRLVALLAALLLATTGLVVASPGHASAAPDNHRMATWNMREGATQERWQAVQNLAAQYDVLALQEVPDNAPSGARGPYRWGNTNIEEYVWRVQTDGTIRYLYILRQPSRSLGIMTSWYPSDVFGVGGVYRDGLAAVNRDDNTVFASVHAESPGGNDAASLVRRVRRAAGNRPFVALGDFNRAPADLAPGIAGLGLHIYNPGQPTHTSGNELDYMVSNVYTDQWQASALPSRGSDHVPVAFTSMAAAGYYSTITNDSTEGGVITAAGGIASGTPVVAGPNPHALGLIWRVTPDVTVGNTNLYYRIQLPSASMCVQPRTAGLHAYLDLSACHGAVPGGPANDTQSFDLFVENGTFPDQYMLLNSSGLYTQAITQAGQQNLPLWLTTGANETSEEFHIHPEQG